MKSNLFFLKRNLNINKIFSKFKLDKNFKVNDVKPLQIAKKNDLSFFESPKYKLFANSVRGGSLHSELFQQDHIYVSSDTLDFYNKKYK